MDIVTRHRLRSWRYQGYGEYRRRSERVLFLESFEEYFEGGEWFDIFVGIHIPDLRSIGKPGRSKASLLYHRNLGEFHVFLNAEYSSNDDDD